VLTPVPIARLMATLAVARVARQRTGARVEDAVARLLAPGGRALLRDAGPVPRVLDPAVGTGVFLVAAARVLEKATALPRARIVEHLFGLDLSPASVLFSRFTLLLFVLEEAGLRGELPDLTRSVRIGDPLAHAEPTAAVGPVDVVLANPPYVRQERIDAAAKRAIRDRFERETGGRIPARSDLFVYFFSLLPRLLATRGAAAFITPNSWLNADYGAALRRFLVERFRIDGILEPRRERWFRDASVHTTITLLSTPGPTRDPVPFLALDVPIEPIVSDPRAAARLVEADGPGAPGLRRRHVPPDELLPENAREPRPANPPWGIHLSAPAVHHDLIARAGSRLAPLRERARLRFGLKTGANAFFYLRAEPRDAGLCLVRPSRPLPLDRDSPVDRFLLEERFLAPVLMSPREARGLDVQADGLPLRALTLPPDPDAIAGTHAARYVELGERIGVHRRASVRGRSPWWSLPVRPTPPIAHSLIVDQRPAVFRPPPGVLVDANLVWIEPLTARDHAPVLLGLLSSFGLLCRELYLVANLGQGAIKANPRYLGGVPVPVAVPRDLGPPVARALEAIGARDHLRIAEEIEREDRAALDDLFLRAAGYTGARERDAVRRAILAALGEAVEDRRARSGPARLRP